MLLLMYIKCVHICVSITYVHIWTICTYVMDICEHQCICGAYLYNGVGAALDCCEIYSPVKPDDFSEFWLLAK